MIQNIDELLERLKELRTKYQAGQIKLGAQGLFALVFAGGFDSLCGKKLTLEERYELVEKFKKATGSKATLAKGLKENAGLGDIDSEMMRKVWLAQKNPFYQFHIIDEYSSAIAGEGIPNHPLKNIRKQAHSTMRYRLTFRGQEICVYSNFRFMQTEKFIKYFSNKLVKEAPAVFAKYIGYETVTYGANQQKFYKLELFDGAETFYGTIWPKYGSVEFDPELSGFVRRKQKSVALFIGKVTKNTKGYTNFTIRDIVPF